MKKTHSFLIGLVILFGCGIAKADESSYAYKVSTQVFSSLILDNNTQSFLHKKIQVRLLADQDLSGLSVATTTAKSLMFASVVIPEGVMDVEIPGIIDRGRLSASLSLTEVQAILDGWRAIYKSPAAFKNLSPELKKLQLQENLKLNYQANVTSQNKFTIFLPVQVSTGPIALEDRLDDLKKMVAFMKKLEKHPHGKVIIANNKSGLPAFILQNEDESLMLKHPFHEVVWNKKERTYRYNDALAAVDMLWEVKRLRKEPKIQAQIQEWGDQTVIQMDFRTKKNFDAVLVNRSNGQRISAKMKDNKLSIE